jgi:hypothetical protein
MTISRRIVVEGDKFNIFEILENNKSHFEHFLKNIPKRGRNTLIRNIQWLADKGEMVRKERFRNEGDGIYAIKKDKFRVYCFFDRSKRIILTNGCIKQKTKANPNDLNRAKRLKALYLGERGRE